MTTYNAGVYDYVVPETGDYIVECYGSGGGGGRGAAVQGGSGGGGGSAYASDRVSLTAGQVIPIVVSPGGAGATTVNGAGQDGGVTSFGDLVIADGGKGALANAGGGGEGGSVENSVGSIILPGQSGKANSGYNGGAGGKAGGPLGGEGGASNGQSSGLPGNPPGGGGSGGGQFSSSVGGNGADGQLTIEFDPYVPTYGQVNEEYLVPGVYEFVSEAEGEVDLATVGGGGGGKGGAALSTGGAGGGGGACVSSTLSVSYGDIITITVGSGGAGGPYNNSSPGEDGVDTTVALNGEIVIRARAGTGATSGTGVGIGGSEAESLGDVINPGGNGQPRPASEIYASGSGGSAGAPLGGTGGPSNGQGAGNPGNPPGGGGSGGGAPTGGVGGDGADGAAYLGFYRTRGSVIIGGEEKYVVAVSQIQSGARKNASLISRITNSARKITDRYRQDLSITLPPYPTWLPVGQEALFDRNRGVFNWDIGAPNTIAALAQGDFSYIGVGDSLMEGFTYLNHLPPFNYTSDRLHAFPLMARDVIASQLGSPVSGTGLVRTVGAVGDVDLRWQHSGVTKHGHFVALQSGDSSVFSSNLPGTNVDITIIDHPGTTVISVDGATEGPGYLVHNGGTGELMVVSLSGLTDTEHTVRIEVTSGDLSLFGANVYSPGGIVCHNVAQGGATAMGDTQESWSATSGGYFNMLPVYSDQVACFGNNANAVAIMIGANDMNGSGTKDYAGIISAIETIGVSFDNADTDVILVTEPHASTTFASPSGYSEPLYALQYELALEKGWAVLDAEWLTKGYETLAGLGYTGDIYGHFNTAGAHYVGGLFGSAMLS